jgi:hypothetical protein
MKVSIKIVEQITEENFYVNYIENRSVYCYRQFRTLFGCSPRVVAALYNTLLEQQLITEDKKLLHLLWTLNFLKTYGTETSMAKLFRSSEKTVHKHVGCFLDKYSKLYIVSTYTNYYYYIYLLMLTR